MTPLSEVPINSLAWTFGLAACLALGIRSFIVYRRSYSQLTKYICWFFMIMAVCLAFFGPPAFFTLDVDTLHNTYIIGEVFMYLGFIPQAAILWSLLLRQYFSVYVITIPTALVGLASWLYATPNSILYLENGFIDYREPFVSRLALVLLFGGLFIPVGLHFMKATMRQSGFKDRFVTFVLGSVYAGVGISIAVHLLTVRHVVSPASSVGNLIFFILLLVAIIWPRREKAKSVLPEVQQRSL